MPISASQTVLTTSAVLMPKGTTLGWTLFLSLVPLASWLYLKTFMTFSAFVTFTPLNMSRRYLFRFKVYDELGLCVARGLVSSVLRSDLSLFEYINDGRVTNSSKMSISEFMSYVFAKNKSVVFVPSYSSEYPSL